MQNLFYVNRLPIRIVDVTRKFGIYFLFSPTYMKGRVYFLTFFDTKSGVIDRLIQAGDDEADEDDDS